MPPPPTEQLKGNLLWRYVAPVHLQQWCVVCLFQSIVLHCTNITSVH